MRTLPATYWIPAVIKVFKHNGHKVKPSHKVTLQKLDQGTLRVPLMEQSRPLIAPKVINVPAKGTTPRNVPAEIIVQLEKPWLVTP